MYFEHCQNFGGKKSFLFFQNHNNFQKIPHISLILTWVRKCPIFPLTFPMYFIDFACISLNLTNHWSFEKIKLIFCFQNFGSDQNTEKIFRINNNLHVVWCQDHRAKHNVSKVGWCVALGHFTAVALHVGQARTIVTIMHVRSRRGPP